MVYIIVMVQRQTKYTRAVSDAVARQGHTTNQAIRHDLHKQGIIVSDTTTHRVTQRLQRSGIIREAPKTKDGVMRFDSNTAQHDHFICKSCDGIRDISVSEQIKPLLAEQLDGCKVSGNLVVYGSCNTCSKKTKGTT